MKNLQMSLKKKWFEMTKAGIKIELKRLRIAYIISSYYAYIPDSSKTEDVFKWINKYHRDLIKISESDLSELLDNYKNCDCFFISRLINDKINEL